ncbi:MAG: thiol:disulfide interchange protein DsbA/DsbL [Xanthomonadales bacterium]|nr:thiol:disulfide interchange protein DsbA/DsbL [Xanthomonadales bacterium]
MRRIFLALAILIAAPLVQAQALWHEGQNYFLVSPAQAPSTGDKIEVLEVFSYACIHCANFEPHLAAWKKNKPDNVEVVMMPAAWNPAWEFYARAYYTAEALKVLDKTHQALFNALHIEHLQIRTVDDLTAFYAKYGVDPETFKQTASSFAVETKLKRSKELVPRMGVRGTPEIIVDGKYRFSVATAGGSEKAAFALLDFLIQKAASERPKAEKAAP